MKKRFRSGIKTARTRTFPGADAGSDHGVVMMTFQTRLKNSKKPTQPRIRFDLEKLTDPTVMNAFQATIGGRFAPLATLVDEDADLDSMVTHFNKAVTDTAAELGRQTQWWPRHKAIYFSWFGPELFCLLPGPPGFNCWFSSAPVFQWCCSTPQGSPGVGRNTFLSSPHLCFIIVFICDLFVSRDDPLMS